MDEVMCLWVSSSSYTDGGVTLYRKSPGTLVSSGWGLKQ